MVKNEFIISVIYAVVLVLATARYRALRISKGMS